MLLETIKRTERRQILRLIIIGEKKRLYLGIQGWRTR
jgi:hypothetical protein